MCAHSNSKQTEGELTSKLAEIQGYQQRDKESGSGPRARGASERFLTHLEGRVMAEKHCTSFSVFECG